jgi:hypothetical protein
VIHHPIGISGLILSATSAVMLLPKPGKERYTKDGTVQILGHWSNRAASEEQRLQWRRKYLIDKYVHHGAVTLLFFGFLLQAIDYLIM